MNFLKIAAAALLFAAPLSAANAATYDFSGSPADLGSSHYFTTAGGPGVTVTAGASGILNSCGATVTQSSGGLGVDGCPDSQPWHIDGNPLGSSEWLTVTFDWAVKLVSFGLTDVNEFLDIFFVDHYDLKINDGAFDNGIVALSTNLVGENGVKSFVIRASGSYPLDGDDFKLSSISVSAVPVPAAGLLLLGALGGLAALRRRKSV